MTEKSNKPGAVLVVGATGSVGRHVVAEAVRQGYETRALVRDESRAGRLDPGAQKVAGDLTRAETLADAVAGIDAVVFTQGSSYGDAKAAQRTPCPRERQCLHDRPSRLVRPQRRRPVEDHAAAGRRPPRRKPCGRRHCPAPDRPRAGGQPTQGPRRVGRAHLGLASGGAANPAVLRLPVRLLPALLLPAPRVP